MVLVCNGLLPVAHVEPYQNCSYPSMKSHTKMNLHKQNQSSKLTEARMVRELKSPPVHWLPLSFGDDYQDVQPAEVVLDLVDNC